MRHVPILFSALSLALSIGGCVVHECPPTVHAPVEQVWVKVDVPPPALRAEVEVQPARPSSASVWVDGHYEWRGTWVWVDGFWDTPRAGYVWTAPVVVQVEGGFQYHPGYYRPARVSPPPVYTRPSTVRVSVRPAAAATATGTVQVRGPTAEATVETTPPPVGTATVTASGTARVNAPAATATVRPATATAAGTVRVNAPTATATTPTATGTATVRGPTTATVRPATATAAGTVRVNAPTATTATVPPPTMATVRPATATAAGTVRVNPPTAGMATVAGPTMAAVTPPAATGMVSAATPTAGMAATPPPTDALGNLRCSINTRRAPAGGYITVTGNGFGNDTTVMIGGNIAAIQTRRGSQLRVEVPGGSAGGAVQVTAGQRTATCGNLEIIPR